MSYYHIKGTELSIPPIAEKILKNKTRGLGADVDEERKKVKYPEFLAHYQPDEEGKYKNVKNEDGAKNDKGHLGDPTFKNLFPADKKVTTRNLSPDFGTEVEGIQLSELDEQGKNDLALYLETRGLVVFRDQDFRDKGGDFAVNFGKHFGPLHIHPISISAENNPELLVTYRQGGDSSRYDKEFSSKGDTTGWHSDISFEEYPASFSFFVALEVPPSGGDTVFIDTREAYRRLSPAYQNFLEGLTAIHSNYFQNVLGRLTNTVAKIKEDYYTEHPLVRTHPVTGEKSLFFSRGFVQGIKGLKDKESASVLNFLDHHLATNLDIQVRANHIGGSKLNSKSVIAWDNRLAVHSATLDYLRSTTERRHHYRITVLGEKPYLDKSEGESSNGHTNGHSNGHSNGLKGHQNEDGISKLKLDDE